MNKIVRILKKIKIKNIIILILLLIFNTYAWFVFATRASSSIDVHISSWNVQFAVEEEESSTNILIEVERVYPGMETFEKNITVKNKGEVKAELDYEVISLKVLGETYTVDETMTTEQLENKMKTEFPFKVNVTKNDTELLTGTGPGLFNVTVEWPFESGDDVLDTLWGNKAYEYYSTNPGKKSIEIEVKLTAKQLAN